MKKRLRRLIALPLVACMVFVMTTVSASAEAPEVTYYDGENNIIIGEGDIIQSGATLYPSVPGGGILVYAESSTRLIIPNDTEQEIVDLYTDDDGTKDPNGAYACSSIKLPEVNLAGFEEYEKGYRNDQWQFVGAEFSDIYWCKVNGSTDDTAVYTRLETVILKPVPIAYTVHFDANGGEGTMADQAFTYGEAQTLTANAFTKEGYEFVGWKHTHDDGETIEVFADKTNVNKLTTEDGGTVTLQAVWQLDSTSDSDEPSQGADKSPDTGDDFSVAPFLALVVISAAGLAMALRRKKA